jgi:ribonuclease BN (tRNA processing enzyme)
MRILVALAALVLMSCASVADPGRNSSPTTQSANSVWITLGTSGGPQVRPERAQIANALQVGGAIYLFDVGNDVQRQMARAGLAERDVRAIFLSHHHLDHIADLGPLLWTRWTFGGGPLRVIGPVGTRELVEGLIDAAGPVTLAGYPTAGPVKPTLRDLVTVEEIETDLSAPKQVYADGILSVSAIGVAHYQTAPSVPLEHMPQAVAFRAEGGGRSIAYTGDSGPDERLALIAQGADLLVSEVVELDAITMLLERGFGKGAASVAEGMAVNHLTPARVGRIAADAKVAQVVLTHFVPVPEQVGDQGIYAREIAKDYAGPVRLAQDLDRF